MSYKEKLSPKQIDEAVSDGVGRVMGREYVRNKYGLDDDEIASLMFDHEMELCDRCEEYSDCALFNDDGLCEDCQ